MTEEKNKIKTPKKLEDLEVLADNLAKINYPKYIAQRIRGGALYKCVHEELSSRLINMIIVGMYERRPITYTTKKGYTFLVSE